jgi:AraC family transcriptional regulator
MAAEPLGTPSAFRLRMGVARETLRRMLRADCPIGSAVRVRLWEHVEERSVACPSSAHPTVELMWLESGTLLYEIGSQRFELSAGQALVVPAGVEHKTTLLAPCRAGALWLDAEMVAEIADAVGRPGERLTPGPAEQPAAILALGRIVSAEVGQRTPGHLLAAEAIAEAMTVAMLRTAPGRSVHATARHPRVLAALERMHTGYAEPLTVDELARTAGMSRFHFSRLFREEVGEAPYQYLLGVRIARAREVLQCGRASVTEAALAVGFHDLSRFSRAFRERFDVGPADFARRARARRAVSFPPARTTSSAAFRTST